MSKISAIDVFCGVGGLTKGLEQSGIKVNLGIDIDENCKFPYEANNSGKFLQKSVAELDSKELEKFFDRGSIRLLAGCAPCQTFSSHGRNIKHSEGDQRWYLLNEFKRFINDINPEIVTMENVPGLKNHLIFDEFLHFLYKKKYFVDYSVVECSDYGLPQKRKRLVLIASKKNKISLLPPTHKHHKKTVYDAIGNLTPINSGQSDINDALHKSALLSRLNLKRIRASTPGGTWKDWHPSLISNCHKKESGKKFTSVYSRMEWNKPSPTITTQFLGFSRGRYGHPEQDRALSLREGAILQGFPTNYIFNEPNQPINNTSISRLIGNAVPVDLGRVIGNSILKSLGKL